MEYKNLISERLGKESFYKNGYYKFEKYSKLKQRHIENHNEELIDFGIGEGDDMPPFNVINTINEQARIYENRVYSDNGFDEFKLACSKHLKDNYNVTIDNPLTQINQCIGAKSALTIIPISFISNGDIVISTTPGYEVLANMSSWLNAKIYKVPLLKENNFLPDLDSIPEEIYKMCKLFSINYPNNPTGAIANKEFYEKLISLALKYNFIIVNDMAYGPFSYKSKPLSMLSIKNAFDCVIEVHTLSKAYNMTGMRVGFVVSNPKLIDIFKKVKDNIDSGQYIPLLKGAIEAYNNCSEYLKRLTNKYYQRMKKVSKIFNKYGFKNSVSSGTFYLYIKVIEPFKSADEMCRYLLENCSIFTIPWDEVEPHIRLSMTFKVSNNEQAFYELLEERLKRICK